MRFMFFYCFVFLSLIFTQKDNSKNKIKINEDKIINESEVTSDYLDLYRKSFELLKINYVDSINDAEVIKSGIKGLMKTLDPYTKLLEGNSKESYDILRKGKYGGVGIQIGVRRDTLTVLAPMEDSPAYTEGIHAGDQILMIDSTKTKGMTVKDAANIIKGEIKTVVELSILRPSTKERLKFRLKRDNISVKHVPYWGVDENGIGYVRVTRFSKNSSKDFKEALKVLSDDKLNGLIIDLRGNSGGLLSNATKILDYLTERGELLLSSKGNINRTNREWVSRTKPIIDINIPIAVLINKSSASASEIVAGSLQDLDRAVIIGQKSFGKGLVQHMYDLNDTLTLKITTQKYYLPSGRLIQKLDYRSDGFLTDGLDTLDTIFYSKSGRKLKGGAGITPDVVTIRHSLSPYLNALWKEGAFLSFAAYYVPMHRQEIQVPITISNKMMSQFKSFLNDFNLDFTLNEQKDFDKLKNKLYKTSISINNHSNNISYNNNSIDLISDFEDYLNQLKLIQYNLEENQRWIKNGLLREISRVAVDEKERIKVSLYEDDEYHEASVILLNLKEYYKLLNI